jgi:short-subunit dehydrogenase
MDLQLAGKVALITGSSRGIGLATATAFAAEGCRLMLAARSAEPLAIAAAALRTRGVDVAAHPADVQFISDAPNSTYFYRLKLNPDPKTEDTKRDLNMKKLTFPRIMW